MSSRFTRDSNGRGAVSPGRSLWTVRVALGAIVLAGGCARPVPEVDPFVVAPAQFYESVGTIVATPVSLPEGVTAPESVLTWFEALIEATLEQGGFTVVPTREYVDIWNRINEEAGGFFDPFTGERDEPRYQAGVDQLFAELEERFSFDAVLYPEMWIVEAPASGGYARWDGVVQNVGASPPSTVLALSLAVVVQDMDGAELYSNVWGLEVLELYNRYLGGFVPVPSEVLFADQERNTTAVVKALGPLIERSTGGGDAVTPDSSGIPYFEFD